MIIQDWRNRLMGEEKDFVEYVQQMRDKGYGYGAMMQFISFMWYEKDPIGAMSVGNCYGTIKSCHEKDICVECERALPIVEIQSEEGEKP